MVKDLYQRLLFADYKGDKAVKKADGIVRIAVQEMKKPKELNLD